MVIKKNNKRRMKNLDYVVVLFFDQSFGISTIVTKRNYQRKETKSRLTVLVQDSNQVELLWL
jgi:hypothetical protein